MTVHAPFHEIFPGAPDRLVREAAIARLDAAFDLMAAFAPRSVVMHLNHENRRFGFVADDWFAHIVPAIEHYAGAPAGWERSSRPENVYEESPGRWCASWARSPTGMFPFVSTSVISNAFSETKHRGLACRDGAVLCASFICTTMTARANAHGPIGSGTVRFDLVAVFIGRMDVRPLITLEPHNEADIWRTLDGLERSGVVEALSRF